MQAQTGRQIEIEPDAHAFGWDQRNVLAVLLSGREFGIRQRQIGGQRQPWRDAAPHGDLDPLPSGFAGVDVGAERAEGGIGIEDDLVLGVDPEQAHVEP